MTLLRTLTPKEVRSLKRSAFSAQAFETAQQIIADVKQHGKAALIRHGERLGDIKPGQRLLLSRSDMQQVFEALPREEQELLGRTAARITAFAAAQLRTLSPLSVAVPGGNAGHIILPLKAAGCYAPSGLFPLPSTALMTVCAAKTAGVARIVACSPRPAPTTIGAAFIAGADQLLTVGGAQGIAALAYGIEELEPCDIVVGPGNQFVTAAKFIVSQDVAIDMLCGPSELVIVADQTADPEVIGADLLAQAEHSPDAFPVLITTAAALAEQVEKVLLRQLGELKSPEPAQMALQTGFKVIVRSLAEAAELADRLAPEHLELAVKDATLERPRFTNYGAIFLGHLSGEVLADYGIGPNHVLPTGGTARFRGGLSVFNFLRISTWLDISSAEQAVSAALDAANLARLEGLEAHARSVEMRFNN